MRVGGTAGSGDKYHSVTQLNEEAFLGRKSQCQNKERRCCAYGTGKRAQGQTGSVTGCLSWLGSPVRSTSLQCQFGSSASQET